MKGEAKSLKWLINAEKIEVPFFQRPYVWSDPEFDALIESFNDSEDNAMPFFGSLILKVVSEDDDNKEYTIIDGQQRVTTFSILVRALLDVVEEKGIKLASTVLVELKGLIYNTEVTDDGEEDYEIKLIPSNSDEKYYKKIMDTTVARPLTIEENTVEPIEHAYSYFYNFFSINQDSVKKYALKLRSDVNSLIYIILGTKDDEQKIFDSVNSLGKTLSNSDIIKNYLFQKMRELANNDSHKLKEINNLYEKYWSSIFLSEENKNFWYTRTTRGRNEVDNLECFLRDYGVIRGKYGAKKTPGVSGLCRAYKKELIDTLDYDGLKQLVIEIHDYAKVYLKYKTDYAAISNIVWDDHLNRLLLILDTLETTTFDPYILKVLKENPSDINDKLNNFERFFLKRFIYDGTTKNYNQCCEGLIRAYDDVEFYKTYMSESPVENDTYKVKFRRLNNKQGVLMLFLIEALLRKGEEDKYSDVLNIKSYTLEHIMPQKWSSNSDWLIVDSYDEQGNLVDRNDVTNFYAIRNKAVKSLGNFALLTAKLNSSISNSAFAVKVNGNGKKNGEGIRKYASSLITTKKIIELSDSNLQWDEKAIYSKEEEYFNILNDFYHFDE